MSTLDRNLTIAQEHEEGASYGDLADKYGLSRSRVQQICDNVRTRTIPLDPYDVRKVHRIMSSLQVRLGRMTQDLHALASEVADLERLLQVTLFPEEEKKVDKAPRNRPTNGL